jgi:hypothetical protein
MKYFWCPQSRTIALIYEAGCDFKETVVIITPGKLKQVLAHDTVATLTQGTISQGRNLKRHIFTPACLKPPNFTPLENEQLIITQT